MTCLLLLGVANMSFGQYANKLFDIDSAIDWGRAIFARDDGSYFITGNFGSTLPYSSLLTMSLSANGDTVLSKHTFSIDSGGLFQGEWGEARHLTGGGYISSLVIQYPNPVTGYLYSAAGFVRYKENGDTVFLKTYTDTSAFFNIILDCDIMPDSGFVGGGGMELTLHLIQAA